MNKERAQKSINSERFISLVKDTIAQNPSLGGADQTPVADAKLAEIRHGLESSIELYAQDRHCELDDFWPGFIDQLKALGAADDSTKSSSDTTATTTTGATNEASLSEEEALLAQQQGEVSEETTPHSPDKAKTGAGFQKRVITQAEIEERAKMNRGRPRYLAPEDDYDEVEKTITDPIAYLKYSVLYKESTQKAIEVNGIMADVEINDGNTNTGNEKNPGKWTPTSKIDAKGYGTYYRAIEGTPFHSLKVVGEVDSNILSTLAVLCELDLYKEWYPMCWHSEELGRVGDLHRWSAFTITCPWPVASRFVFIGGFGVDVVYKNKIVIVAKSIDPSSDYVPVECRIPTPQSRTVTANLTCGGFVLEPISGGKTKVSFTMNIDPKLKVVPTSMINWVSGKLIWVLLKQLGAAAAKSDKVGSAYHKRREEQKELYEYFRQRAQQVLPDLFVADQ